MVTHGLTGHANVIAIKIICRY